MMMEIDTGVSELQKELNSYTMLWFTVLSEQKEWTEKSIRTRGKLEKLEKLIRNTGLSFEGKVTTIGLIEHLLSSVQVNETPDGYLRVRVLSQKGVEWCNKMWNKLK